MNHLNLISLLGIFVMIGLAWLVSSHRTKVNWRLVVIGIALQAVFAAVLFQSQNWTFNKQFSDFGEVKTAVEAGNFPVTRLDDVLAKTEFKSFEAASKALEDSQTTEAALTKVITNDNGDIRIATYPNGILFAGVNSFFESINKYVEEGSSFVFRANGSKSDPLELLKTFAFGVLPTVIFFASLMSILYYLGVMQILIKLMSWVMQKTLGTSGPESMAAAANVLVGHTEAPLVVRPFVENMTRSELNALMVGGFATISGSLMAIFVVFSGISAGHLLTASIISAPAALVIAKIMQPETETTAAVTTIEKEPDNAATNVIEAAAIGASDGVQLAINITAMLIAFLALLAMANALLAGFGELVQYLINLVVVTPVDLQWSLNNLFAALFYPLAWIMGIETGDCAIAGELLGKKVVLNEFVAYSEMGDIMAGKVMDAENNPVSISERTEIIMTYALCGFSNFGAIGIQIGGIGPLAPSRRSDLAQLGLRAMFGGMLAACMTACMAGMMYGILR
ncbi:MAG: NupC/NupG family nucleoside CNT transporter [Mariniblastus sp.]